MALRVRSSKSAILVVAALGLSCAREAPELLAPEDPPPQFIKLSAYARTDQVPYEPDDPAIWRHPTDPSQSIIVGTNKVEKPGGGLVVFDLRGKILQLIGNLDRPNNVDIEQNVKLGAETIDIAVATEREARAVRIYSIDGRTRSLRELAKAPVFEGEQGDFALPMGVGIYKRPDESVFIIVGRKSGPQEGYLWQYRVRRDASLELVRKFGQFSGAREIEAIAVDDELGYVYYADEGAGIRKYHADPDAPDAPRELAFFGRSGYLGNREGLAIYASGGRKGFIVSTDQVERRSRYLLYRREGLGTDAHDHRQLVAVLEGVADATDGIEVVAGPLSNDFPFGLLAAMNSRAKNFLLFPWPPPWDRP